MLSQIESKAVSRRVVGTYLKCRQSKNVFIYGLKSIASLAKRT